MLLKKMLKKIRGINLPPAEHAFRKGCYARSTKGLRESLSKARDEKSFNKLFKGPFPLLELLEKSNFQWALAHDRRWSNWKFGAANNLERSGCLVFVIANLWILFNNSKGVDRKDIKFIRDTIVHKGYRMWKMSKKSPVLNWTKVSLKSLKKKFSEVQEVSTRKEAFSILGKPKGIGGSMYAIDEFLSACCGLEAYVQTRVYDIQEMLDCLHGGNPVIVRVNRGILLQKDPTEGHYAILLGFDENQRAAVLLDSSSKDGIMMVPIEVFIDSMLHDEAMVSAWNTMPSKH